MAKAALGRAIEAAAKYKAFMESDSKVRDSMNVRYMFEHRGLPWLWLKKPDLFSPESIHDIVGMTWATSAKFARIP